MPIDLLLRHSTLAYGPDQVKILFEENQSPHDPEAVIKKGCRQLIRNFWVELFESPHAAVFHEFLSISGLGSSYSAVKPAFVKEP